MTSSRLRSTRLPNLNTKCLIRRVAGFQSEIKLDRLKACGTKQKRDFKETVLPPLVPFLGDPMQTHDIIIFTVVLTTVSLAAAQSVLLKLSDKAEEVPLVNKIIGILGVGSAGFTLFLSKAFMGKHESTILILLVLAIALVTWLIGRIRTPLAPQPEILSIPEAACSSLVPNPKLAWCGNCKAHTLPGEVTVRNTNEYGRTYMTYQRKVCGHCKGNMLWNIPSDIRQSTNWTLGCSGVIGLTTICGLTAVLVYESQTGAIIGILAAMLLVPVLAFLVWILYLRLQWCKWLRQQSCERSVYSNNEAQN